MLRRALLCLLLLTTISISRAADYPPINHKNITIIRDSFGIAHVYGGTDAEAAYGLAWANAEDAFHLMQEPLLAAKGLLGRQHGAEGAGADFFVHAIGARNFVELNYESHLSEEFREYLNGYVQGINAYAEAHPKEIISKKAFPIDGKDVMTAFVASSSFLSGASGPFEDIYTGEYDGRHVEYAKGSNAFAFAPQRTADGLTYLCINPHFAMEGQFTFYEAHIASEEGLNFHGVTFQGASSFAMGNNTELGFGMTWNYFDRVDVYKLKMHPDKKLHYEVNGEYFELETRPVTLKVKLGFIVIPVPKKSYWSGFGPVIKSKKGGFYALRFPANMYMGIAQQMYELNKSKNLTEFKDAMRNPGLMMFNVVYADKEGNIMYVSNGMVPDRPEGYDYSEILPGDTTGALWTSLIPFDSLPQVQNPSCGYVMNTNNSPYNATCEGENDNPNRLPDYLDERPGDNNRAIRLREQIENHPIVGFEDMKRMKFDSRFSTESVFWKSLDPLFNINIEAHPELADIYELLMNWDRHATIESSGTTVFALVMSYIFRKNDYEDEKFVFGLPQQEKDYIQALTAAKKWLLEYYGTLDVPFGEIHRIRRLDKDLPCPGFPDALAATYGVEEVGSGKFYPEYGDSYTHFVAFSKDGPVRMETLTPFGASFKEESPHFSDQMELFVNREMKTMSLDKAFWMNNAERIYHPGE